MPVTSSKHNGVRNSFNKLTRPLVLCVSLGLAVAGCMPQSDDKEQADINASTSYISALGNASGRSASPEYVIKFPDDHASHDQYSVEWWYFTANLFDTNMRSYAVQWTLFRFLTDQPSLPWANAQGFMAHAKLLTPDGHYFAERFARGGVGNGGVEISPVFNAYLDDWQWLGQSPDLLPARLTFSVPIEQSQREMNIALSLNSTGPYVLHGINGYSQKLASGDHGSMYYSHPFIQVSGAVSDGKKRLELTGQGWFDHEWSGQLTDQDTLGWNWFSLHLDDGSKLMLFCMRHKTEPDYWSGSFISPAGEVENINSSQVIASIGEYSQVKDKTLPLHWSIALPDKNISLQITPLTDDQWNEGIFSYYEGAVHATGSHQGRGFLEMTGY